MHPQLHEVPGGGGFAIVVTSPGCLTLCRSSYGRNSPVENLGIYHRRTNLTDMLKIESHTFLTTI
jgi:hypothetical protein